MNYSRFKMPRNKPHRRYMTCVLSLFVLSLDLPAQEPVPVRLAGTDLLKGPIGESIEKAAGQMTLEAQWPGTRKALQLLRAGKVDLAIVTGMSPKDMPEVAGMRQIPLAYRISRVVVAKDNLLDSITIEQLRAIFGNRASRKLDLWGGLGLSGAWSSRGIQPMVTERFTTFSREIFEHHALRDDRLQATIKVFADEQALATTFKQNPGAIGVFASLNVEGFGKSLPIAFKEGEAFGATPENLYFGDYPLQMPFIVLFPETRLQELAPVIRTFYSSEVARIIFQNGLAPVPDNFRLAELKKLSDH